MFFFLWIGAEVSIYKDYVHSIISKQALLEEKEVYILGASKQLKLCTSVLSFQQQSFKVHGNPSTVQVINKLKKSNVYILLFPTLTIW